MLRGKGGGGGAKEGVTTALQLHLRGQLSKVLEGERACKSPGGRKIHKIYLVNYSKRHIRREVKREEGTPPTPALSRGRRSEVRP